MVDIQPSDEPELEACIQGNHRIQMIEDENIRIVSKIDHLWDLIRRIVDADCTRARAYGNERRRAVTLTGVIVVFNGQLQCPEAPAGCWDHTTRRVKLERRGTSRCRSHRATETA